MALPKYLGTGTTEGFAEFTPEPYHQAVILSEAKDFYTASATPAEAVSCDHSIIDWTSRPQLVAQECRWAVAREGSAV
jgi:hypothetical protein